MILKLLAIVVVLVLVYIVFFKKDREGVIKKNNEKKENIEDIMVECPSCGTYVSKKEGILSNGNYFCSVECLNNKAK